jgi:hypothetical protein
MVYTYKGISNEGNLNEWLKLLFVDPNCNEGKLMVYTSLYFFVIRYKRPNIFKFGNYVSTL